MEPFPNRIVHDGLVLRRWTVADAARLDALVRDNIEHLRPYMPWVASEPLSIVQRRQLLADWDTAWAAGGDAAYGIYEADSDDAVGGTGLHHRIGGGGLEIGYWVSHRYLGRGIARRASEALTSFAFTVPGIERVEIHHDMTNVHSRRVPEQLGFHLAGKTTLDRALAPGETGLELVWRVGRDEWLARSTPEDQSEG